uniref:Poly [ADP-ribose] polymerase n=1 Tax=Spodoptera frugiperda TaxID=7108 RepID=A0A2H1VI59_SPOFR
MTDRDLSYKVEYAKSGRSTCKACNNKIDEGTVRIAVLVQSIHFDGKETRWHHEKCFFTSNQPTSTAEIGNFCNLKNDDQARIKSQIEKPMGMVVPVTKPSNPKKRPTDPEAVSNVLALKDYTIQCCKSNKISCTHCGIKICKDEIRISKNVFNNSLQKKVPSSYHIKCFLELRNELHFYAGGESIPGFKTLKKKDKEMVMAEIKPLSDDEIPTKKLKTETSEEDKKKMVEQNELFHKYRKALSVLSKQDMEKLLEANSQKLRYNSGPNERLDSLAECMAFGKLEPCEVCKQGQLVLLTNKYKCTGHLTEWTKCTYVTQNPKRLPMVIPTEFAKNPIFENFTPTTDVRLFETAPEPEAKLVTPAKKEVVSVIPPLKDLQFYFYGDVNNKEEIHKRILKLGGVVITQLLDTTAAVVSTKADVDKMLFKMKEIQSKDIQVVEETFFDVIEKASSCTVAQSLELIKENNIADWGSDPASRIPTQILGEKSSTSTNSVLKLAGGSSVDPACGLNTSKVHVYVDTNNTKYTVVLSLTDIVAQKNSYYKLQVLEADDKKKYWLFVSWGRIGTNFGKSKTEPCKSRAEAVKKFESLFQQKTQNDWNNRGQFKKVPGRYYPLEMDNASDFASNETLVVSDKCALDKSVQKLIIKLFDVKTMNKTLTEFELDTEKMPLGKLSKNQIIAGYNILSEVQALIDSGSIDKIKFIDATNRFFTLIPHNFGTNNPPLLDNAEIIRSKAALLDNLLEIELAYSLFKIRTNESNPILANYLKLKVDIALLPDTSPEYAMINEYLDNTHGHSHVKYYTLSLQKVFKVVREGEDDRFSPFKNLHNRRLLWHGSRTTNFVGILSQGLRIAPPEAPVTGYMFGKGVYFADMVTKSANYCRKNYFDTIGFLLLCEVALGNMHKVIHSNSTPLPRGMDSRFGEGATIPDPAQNRILDDGTMVPLGKPIRIKPDSPDTLRYNEFIVYNEAQVKVKYLLQVKFNYVNSPVVK